MHDLQLPIQSYQFPIKSNDLFNSVVPMTQIHLLRYSIGTHRNLYIKTTIIGSLLCYVQHSPAHCTDVCLPHLNGRILTLASHSSPVQFPHSLVPIPSETSPPNNRIILCNSDERSYDDDDRLIFVYQYAHVDGRQKFSRIKEQYLTIIIIIITIINIISAWLEPPTG